ncbi:MAG: rhomboid family intramembrane serine protease [Chloroflexi bacterium]|nr:rhomboid family intramembrane serine protease [Chloroflexota bacterium]MBV9600559.1 rhomboid family intramembrane serine protease [Chloroflexota bacterium]
MGAHPVVTLALVVANVVLFVVELSQGGQIDAFVRRWGLVPADVHDGPAAAAITLLTSTFLHAGWFHLAANMIYLAVFGPPVERRLGPTRFLVLYVASGLIGSLAYVLVQPLSAAPAVGASGAIAGVIAAFLVLFPGATLGSLAPVLFLHVVESTPTLLLLLLWLATQVFSSVASLTTATGIAWWAHLGGFASGLVLAPVLRTRRS